MERWKSYLINTKEKNYNIEHLDKIKNNSKKLVYSYVKRSLDILESKNLDDKQKYYVKETLKWMDVAKTGSKEERKVWKEKGYNLHVHNLGSAQIYKESKNYDKVVYVLIKTHGLIGQCIRGEVKFSDNKELYSLIEDGFINKDDLRVVLEVLNECIIRAINDDIYNNIKDEITVFINDVINNNFDTDYSVKNRIIRLNNGLSKDNKKLLDTYLNNKDILFYLTKLFDKVDFWYYEIAISNFSIEEQIKILLICYNNIKEEKHLTFENVMKTMYLDYNDKKEVNLFKKRIIEEYLKNIDIDHILNNRVAPNLNISFKISNKYEDTLVFDFKFSKVASKLVDFCETAIYSDSLYKKSIYMLYDLLGFRKDKYDRFYNEIDYLNRMNSSLSYKAKILDYMVGKNVLDVGPGGGALMDLIEKKNNKLNVFGIDISSNVIEALEKKKKEEKRRWNLVKGDALNLKDYFKKGSLDTIIYSSIIHELYSYIPYNGKKFNLETVKQALISAYDILPTGGRIIIRDGIKTEPENEYRIIKFKNIDDNKILDNYCKDFKGRKITYERLSDVKVKMLVNDAMEFLYTYTWGPDSYPLEVQEQFGYLTPTEYKNLINENLKNANIIICHAFLQDGYEENLLNKISIYDEDMNVVKLPNSTCIIVIEKGE